VTKLEFAIVEFIISSLRGAPPMKDGSYSKQRSCRESILQVAENKEDGRREISYLVTRGSIEGGREVRRRNNMTGQEAERRERGAERSG